MNDNNKPDLDSAYALKTPEDTVRFYDGWAGTYDQEFAAARGYQTPMVIGDFFRRVSRPSDTPLLDVGCGTGLLAEALPHHTHTQMHGLDISPKMLEVAKSKKVYSKLIEGNVVETLPMKDETYGAILSAGTFTTGHVGPEGLDELLRVAKPMALFILSVHAGHYERQGFGARFRELADESVISLPHEEVFDFYKKAEGDHVRDQGCLVVFRKE
ncbi:MAG: class I SAM-dependent DNA methyltransferase [Rhizobiaceae bacterium]